MAASSWINASVTFKSKWKVCDGAGGTPNLTGRFLRGGTASDPLTGDGKMTLTEYNLPGHTHSGSTNFTGAHGHSYYDMTHIAAPPYNTADLMIDDGYNRWKTVAASTSLEGNHVHTVTIGQTGGGQSFDVVPAFYTVIYIMKMA
ncbi:MAG: hypothetical protein LBJ25_00045 [Candidatus Margulisbacteria bacterium]|jgi:hypothetical protein|nr:hypothetical protein [Candidatus Margulisiibacteriota bacterium]